MIVSDLTAYFVNKVTSVSGVVSLFPYLLVDTFGTGKLKDEEISEIVRKEFDLRPTAIIKTLDLRKPQYKQLASI